MLPQAVLLLLCFPIVSSYCGDCQDVFPFCEKLLKSHCNLRIARSLCRRTCGSCCDSLGPQIPLGECKDQRSDCSTKFYLCGVCSGFTEGCKATCGACRPKPPTDDPVAVCIRKYGGDYCNKLGAACSYVTRTPIPRFTTGPEYVLPSCISECMIKENPVAMCYAKYCTQRCNKWLKVCKIASPYVPVSSDQAKCLQDQTILDSCVSKYGAKFCYSLVESCSVMLSIKLNGNMVQLPVKVLDCMKTENVFAMCRAKHGITFCTKLTQSCAILTKQPVPVIKDGQLVVLQSTIAKCVSEENYFAILFVEFGKVKVEQWMTKCKVTVWNGPITVIQKECIREVKLKPDPKALCVEKYGAEFCRRLEMSCFKLNKLAISSQTFCTLCEVPDKVGECMMEENSIAMFYARYGYEKVTVWINTCKIKITTTNGLITSVEQACLKKQKDMPDVMTVCKTKYGLEYCTKLQTACFEIMKLPILTGSNAVIPATVLICIQSDNWMANCYAKYGRRLCVRWRDMCRSRHSRIDADLLDSEKDCIKSQTIIYKCTQKYESKICYQMIQVCSEILNVPYTHGPVQRLSVNVLDCLKSDNVMVLCRARHGYVFCEKLAKGCSRLAKVTISGSLSGLTIKFPEIVVTCIREEQYLPQLIVEYGFTKIEAWMTLCKITVWNGPITVVQKECVVKQTRLPDARSQCIKKYGADFCSTLITSCFEVTNTEFLGEKPCAICELPAKVYVCLQKENPVAMCYAKYGARYCITWLKTCKIQVDVDLTTVQIDCLIKQTKAYDSFTYCVKKYGQVFCKKFQIACFEVLHLPTPIDGVVQVIPAAVSICIASENWMAHCFVKWGRTVCLQWRQTCKRAEVVTDWQLDENEVECMKSQSIIYKCVQRYDAKLCYRIIAVCSQIYSVPYTEGPVQRMPQTVIRCLHSDNAMVMCRARHNDLFCKKLTYACATVLKVRVPSVRFDRVYELPVAVAGCVLQEHYLPIQIVEYGITKIETWTHICKITVWTGPFTAVQKECIKKESLLPEPRTLCIEKYGVEFCNKLITGCFELKKLRLCGQKPCLACELPSVINICLKEENYIAMCYAKYGIAQCNQWIFRCRVRDRYGQLSASEKACIQKEADLLDVMKACIKKHGEVFCKQIRTACFDLMKISLPVNGAQALMPTSISVCISTEYWMARCYVKYGQRLCRSWRQTCLTRYSRLDSVLIEEEEECVRSQTIIYKCVQKHDAKFCYKVISVCSAMYGIPYTEGPVQRLTERVITCLQKEDVIVICRAKHGTDFCNKLSATCARLTNTSIPRITIGIDYTLPETLVKCILNEYYVAVLYIEFPAVHVEEWVKRCKITVWNGPITVIQKHCLKKLSETPDPRTLCAEKYGADFCTKLVRFCYVLHHYPVDMQTPCPVCLLPEKIAECVTTENYLAMCYAKYGSARCMQWLELCKITPDRWLTLSSADKACMKKQNELPDAMTLCIKRYDNEYCLKLRTACFEVMHIAIPVIKPGEVSVLPASVVICIQSEDWMAKCYSKYGSKQCIEWRETCRDKYSRSDDELTSSEKECIESQMVIYKCVQKYDANFCYKIISVCSGMYSIPYVEGPVQKLPQKVVTCLYSEDVIVLCRAKHGFEFCQKLSIACAQFTKVTIPTLVMDRFYKLPEVVTKCVSEEYYAAVLVVEYGFVKIQTWMRTCNITIWNGPVTVIQKECVKKQSTLPDEKALCVQKYGAEFCNKLVTSCYELKKIPAVKAESCSVCEIPPLITTCVKKEDYIAMCYAKFGQPKCNAWMIACRVRNRFAHLTEKQKECIKKQSEQTDVIAVCTKKYGAEFCTKLKNSCFEILKVKATDGALPVSISICISSENWLAQCYAKYGAKRCNEWREICRDKYSKTSDLTESEKECVKSQTIIAKCVTKYDANFCYKMIAACCSFYSIPYVEGPVQRLPPRVVRCMNSDNAVILCRAKHGNVFCEKLAASCSMVLRLPAPRLRARFIFSMPAKLSDCIKKENYGAMLSVEFGFSRVQTWMQTCKVTITTGTVTTVEKQCIEKLEISAPVDPKKKCIKKYGAEFCERLIKACFRLKRMRYKGICDGCELPRRIAECVDKENFLAMMYAEFGVSTCNSWKIACKISRILTVLNGAQTECIKRQSKAPDMITICLKKNNAEYCKKLESACYEVMKIKPSQGKQPPLIAICISSENWLASCYARYGSKQCVEWSLKCKSKYSGVGGDVTVKVKECVMSMAAECKCVQKYGAELCKKIVAVCTSMLGVPYTEGAMHKLPKQAVQCVYNVDPVVMCRAKHCRAFCNKLGAACAFVTKTPMPRYSIGCRDSLPKPIAQCMQKENFSAMCIAKYCPEQCQAWFEQCRIANGKAKLNKKEAECFQKKEQGGAPLCRPPVCIASVTILKLGTAGA